LGGRSIQAQRCLSRWYVETRNTHSTLRLTAI
jgi:hypothetical protein